MMKSLLALPLLLAASTAIADTCPDLSSIAGEYETKVREGFTPNKLRIELSSDGSWTVTVMSYYASMPFDDGSHGSIGEFSGDLVIAQPWSCQAELIVAKPENTGEDAEPACSLHFHFIDDSTVSIGADDSCDYYHGYQATPSGEYLRKLAP